MVQRLRQLASDLDETLRPEAVASKHDKRGNWEMSSTSALLGHVATVQAGFAAARLRDADLLAPEFSLFQFIRADELQLSNILAWLLRPTGSHGQGSRFLVRFVQTFGFAWDQAACDQASVRTEVATSRLDAARRIDILIQSGDRAIAIENKPAAADQNNQVQDYLIHLDHEYKGGRHLIYLSAKGAPPSLASITDQERDRRISTNELAILGYGNLLPWIEACKKVCRADRVTFFLDEFLQYIQQRFLGVRDMTERDQIIAEMTNSSEAISASFQVIATAEQMKAALITKLETQLQHAMTGRGWKLKQKSTPDRSRGTGARGSGFLIQFSDADQFAFALGFGNDQRSVVNYGINIIGATPPDAAEPIHAAMTRAFGPGEKWPPVWLWGRQANTNDQCLPIDGDWTSSDRPWLAIADGSMAGVIVNAAEKVRTVLAAHDLIAARQVFEGAG